MLAAFSRGRSACRTTSAFCPRNTSPGSGNETGMAQIVADRLGCEIERIRVVQGDTETCPWLMPV